MHSATIRDTKELNTLLSLSDAGYVDAIFRNGNAFFISNSSAVFGYMITDCTASDGQADLICRIPVKLLKGMSTAKHLEVTEKDDGNLRIDFEDELRNIICSVTFDKQISLYESYNYKIKLCESADSVKSKEFDLMELQDMMKVARDSLSVLSVYREVANVNLEGNGRMFKKVSIKENFSISSEGLSKLLKVNSTVRTVENYLYTQSNSLRVLCTQSQLIDSTDYEDIKNHKSFFRAEINLRNLITLTSKLDIKIDTAIVDVDTELCNFIQDKLTYELKIPLHNAYHELGSKVEIINLPSYIILKVIPHFKDQVYNISIGRTEIVLERGELLIAFGRGDIRRAKKE